MYLPFMVLMPNLLIKVKHSKEDVHGLSTPCGPTYSASHRPILGSFIPRLSPIQRQSFWNSLLSSTSSIFFPCYWVTLIYIKICYFSDIKKSPLLTQFSLWMSIPLFCSSMEKKILKFIYLSFLVLPMFSLKFIPTGLAGWQLHWNCSC